MTCLVSTTHGISTGDTDLNNIDPRTLEVDILEGTRYHLLQF